MWARFFLGFLTISWTHGYGIFRFSPPSATAFLLNPISQRIPKHVPTYLYLSICVIDKCSRNTGTFRRVLKYYGGTIHISKLARPVPAEAMRKEESSATHDPSNNDALGSATKGFMWQKLLFTRHNSKKCRAHMERQKSRLFRSTKYKKLKVFLSCASESPNTYLIE